MILLSDTIVPSGKSVSKNAVRATGPKGFARASLGVDVQTFAPAATQPRCYSIARLTKRKAKARTNMSIP